MARITFVTGIESGKSREIDVGGPVVIGRSEECDLVLGDAIVSSRHARIEHTPAGWRVTDLDSSNGTFVDRRRINRPTPLGSGALVELGAEVSFRFYSSAEMGQPPPEATPAELDLIRQMADRTEQIRREVAKVIIGQTEVVEQLIMVLLAGGHGLLVGMPGMAKTLMVSTVARVLDLEFRRIQFTPDLMPTDMTGTEVLETDRATQEKTFRFIRGPIFCNLLLADEINRTPPKTQAALLEAMQEKRVTVGNATYPLDAPFFVLATQNPIEQEGTYPLPEAQLDRFMMEIRIGYPSQDQEEEIVRMTSGGQPALPQPIMGREDFIALRDLVAGIPLPQSVVSYAVRLCAASRPADARAIPEVKKYVEWGAGPRGSQYMIAAAKARALLMQRTAPTVDDVRAVALPVLRHRVIVNYQAVGDGVDATDVVNHMLEQVTE